MQLAPLQSGRAVESAIRAKRGGGDAAAGLSQADAASAVAWEDVVGLLYKLSSVDDT
jgi:hypothetical protein